MLWLVISWVVLVVSFGHHPPPLKYGKIQKIIRKIIAKNTEYYGKLRKVRRIMENKKNYGISVFFRVFLYFPYFSEVVVWIFRIFRIFPEKPVRKNILVILIFRIFLVFRIFLYSPYICFWFSIFFWYSPYSAWGHDHGCWWFRLLQADPLWV